MDTSKQTLIRNPSLDLIPLVGILVYSLCS
jgi:hypothetical protein